MKSRLYSIILAFAMVFALSACHDDNTPSEGLAEGHGYVSFASLNVEVSDNEDVIARSASDISEYTVQLLDANSDCIQQWTYAQMPDKQILPEGDYTIRIFNHEVQKAAWEDPYFLGSEKFTITSGETYEVNTVTCLMANIKVSVRYSEDLAALLTDNCHVTVSVNDEGILDFAHNESRSGFFAVVDGSTSMVAEFNGTIAGNPVWFRHLSNDIAAGQHRIITFSLKDPNPGADKNGYIKIDGADIDVDVEVIDINGSVTVPDDDILDDSDRPGHEDPLIGDLDITSDDVSFDKPNGFCEQLIVNVDAKQGVKNLKITINTDNSELLAILEEITLNEEFDLAYPNDKAEALAELGFPIGNDVIGANHVEINLSEFVTIFNWFTGNHSFRICVTDLSDNQIEKTISFIGSN